MSSTAARRTERLIVREVDDETVVYDLDNEMVTVLDAKTAAIWNAADGKASVAGVARKLSTSQDEVAVAFVRLEEARLLKASAGMSRRTLLKGVGVGVAVVPLASMVAPAAAWAASGARIVVRDTGCTSGGNPRKTFVFDATGFDPNQTITVAFTVKNTATPTTTYGTSPASPVTISIGANGSGSSTTITVQQNNTPAVTVDATTSEPRPGGTRTVSVTQNLGAC